jgi:hypothetical protein
MRRIYLPMAMPLATKRHCSNDCPFMDEEPTPGGVVIFFCRLFAKELRWEPQRKTHGNRRLNECKKAEREAASSKRRKAA